MFHYLYTFELKRKVPKAKPAKEQRLSSLGVSWVCWFCAGKQTKGKGLRSKHALVKFGCSFVPQFYPDTNYREADSLPVSPSIIPYSKPHERMAEEACLPQQWWWELHTPSSTRQQKGFASSGFPSLPPRKYLCHTFPAPSRADHTARVSASIFCSPCRFSSSWTWATFCLIAISGPPPYSVLK